MRIDLVIIFGVTHIELDLVHTSAVIVVELRLGEGYRGCLDTRVSQSNRLRTVHTDDAPSCLSCRCRRRRSRRCGRCGLGLPHCVLVHFHALIHDGTRLRIDLVVILVGCGIEYLIYYILAITSHIISVYTV